MEFWNKDAFGLRGSLARASARNKLKIGSLAILCSLAVVAAPQAFAQDEPPTDEEWADTDGQELDDLIHKIQEENDGDDDVPGGAKPPKVQSKIMTTYGAKQALRWKINKHAFVEGYLDQAIGTQDSSYKTPNSKFSGGFSASYLWNGFALSGGVDFKRNYNDVYKDWDGFLDTTYRLGAARKFKLSKEWTLSPSINFSKLQSGKATKELNKTDLSLPFSYALNKQWTLKALALAYSTQTYTHRVEAQTDNTSTASTGFAYKWSEKSTFDVSISSEKRFSNQASAEYTRTSIMPKYEYKISPTSSIGIAVGHETRSSRTEEFSRWILVPKLQLRIEI
jgi:hypothetical protein